MKAFRTENFLYFRIMSMRYELCLIFISHYPSRQCARALAYIVLGIATTMAKGKQFKKFSSKILVGGLLRV
ncbi:hypothetical protein BCA37_07305 [Mycobacterium sp. djl-10]|nr:hypothetical protein BCA37_07305 [Mycobacterium sp. djl-10]